jgi:HEAT repeat protein
MGHGEEDLPSFVEHHVRRLQGPGADDAFHALREAPQGVVPELLAACREERDPGRRAAILEVLGQRRDTSIVPTLEGALRDATTEVWKVALDGLVLVGGHCAAEALSRSMRDLPPNDVRQEWIREALSQIEDP